MVKLNDIIKTENIIKVSPETTLAAALSQLATSHDAAFVFSSAGEYLGVINPFHTLIKSSLPGNSKVANCLFHPPRIYLSDSNERIAAMMDESRVHYLPVFDTEENFLGIVSARRLLSRMQNDNAFLVKIHEALELKKVPLVKINENESVAAAMTSFKTNKVSKLVVVDKSDRLQGVLTYYDLITYLISPKTSPHRGERDGDKISFYSQKVKNFTKSYVLTLSPQDTLSDALALILEMKIGSVVIIDHDHHPSGIITTKDFLRIIMKAKQTKKVEVVTKNLSQTSRQIVGGFFYFFSKHLSQVPQIKKARLFVKEEKEGKLFRVALSLVPKRGPIKIIQQEGMNLLELLNKVKKEHPETKRP